MNTFFLDDDLERHRMLNWELLARDIVPSLVARATTVESAIRILDSSPQFEVAFLDHDLDGRQMVEEIEGTGTAVAQHIAQMAPEKRPRRVIVHSFNPDGAERMMKILTIARISCFYIPFGSAGYFGSFEYSK